MAEYLKLSQLELQTYDWRRVRDWAVSEGASGRDLAIYGATDGSFNYALVQRLASVPSDERSLPMNESRYIGGIVNEVGVADNLHDFIQVVAFNVPTQWRDEIDDWYEREHIGLLMRADGWLRARRMCVDICRGRPFTSIAIHELRDLAVMDAPERRAARATAWRDRFAGESWFEGSGRWLYRRLPIE